MLDVGYSVLMSLYKKESPIFLEQCMESVFNQSVVSNDIVIVFDGPLTIELENVIQMYKDRFPTIIKIIRLEKNQGLGNALNIGLKILRKMIWLQEWILMISQNAVDVKKQLAFMNSNPMILLLEVIFLSSLIVQTNCFI